ncbi:hypothetical protein FSST1_000260 [Fusarium sambucinum]
MSDETVASQAPDEVSGQATFWILITLATAAIIQPSSRIRRKGRDVFDGNIDLLRCIPAVCFLDSIADLVSLGSAFYRAFSTPKPMQNTRRRVFPKMSTFIVKLALSTVTVLPQTIKVASLQGVPATQACSFLFFIATTTRLVVDVCGLEADSNYTNARDKALSLSIPAMVALLLQLPFEVWICLMLCVALVSIAVTKILDALGKLVSRGEEAVLTTDVPSDIPTEGPSPEQESTANDDVDTKVPLSVGLAATWFGRLGAVVDRWLVRALTIHSRASVGIFLTIFNLITTVIYYLVYFNGSGTVNPNWTSVLG